eukprot:766898-Hanusia_phi.AAC.5
MEKDTQVYLTCRGIVQVCKNVMQAYAERTTGTFIEGDKQVASITWHYGSTNPEFGALQGAENVWTPLPSCSSYLLPVLLCSLLVFLFASLLLLLLFHLYLLVVIILLLNSILFPSSCSALPVTPDGLTFVPQARSSSTISRTPWLTFPSRSVQERGRAGARGVE